MGDTHYWTIKDGEKWTSVWDDVVGDIHRIVDYVNAHPESMGFYKGRKEPSVVVRFGEDYVMINDAVEAWAENVILERSRKRSDCCKSVYRSFNPVLQAVLLRMHHYMGDEDLGISSEVGWSWWKRGVGLVQKVFEVVEGPKPEGLRLLMAGQSDDELDLLRSTSYRQVPKCTNAAIAAIMLACPPPESDDCPAPASASRSDSDQRASLL